MLNEEHKAAPPVRSVPATGLAALCVLSRDPLPRWVLNADAPKGTVGLGEHPSSGTPAWAGAEQTASSCAGTASASPPHALLFPSPPAISLSRG